MPLGALLLLAGLLVAPALAGRQRDVRNGTATRQVATFGIGPQVADQDDFVDSARHITLLRCSIKGPPAIPARARPRRRSDTCSGKSREQILLFRPAACHWARADYCPVSPGRRSEERRVGKERWTRGSPYHDRQQNALARPKAATQEADCDKRLS